MTKDKFYNDLDLHADTVEGDVKLPLVVYGDEGDPVNDIDFLIFSSIV